MISVQRRSPCSSSCSLLRFPKSFCDPRVTSLCSHTSACGKTPWTHSEALPQLHPQPRFHIVPKHLLSAGGVLGIRDMAVKQDGHHPALLAPGSRTGVPPRPPAPRAGAQPGRPAGLRCSRQLRGAPRPSCPRRVGPPFCVAAHSCTRQLTCLQPGASAGGLQGPDWNPPGLTRSPDRWLMPAGAGKPHVAPCVILVSSRRGTGAPQQGS